MSFPNFNLLPQYKHSVYCPATFSKSELPFVQLGLYCWSHPGIDDSFETLPHLYHQLYPLIFSTFMVHPLFLKIGTKIAHPGSSSHSRLPGIAKVASLFPSPPNSQTSLLPPLLAQMPYHVPFFVKHMQTTSSLVIVACLSMFFSTTGRFSLNSTFDDDQIIL